MTNVNATAWHASVAGRAVAKAFATILGPVVQVYRTRRQVEHLESLSDHLLADLGVARDEIEPTVRWGRGGHQPWR
jgi:uncharacterized protein YjiS (DUF1127 family)